jgi:hypothetical protein
MRKTSLLLIISTMTALLTGLPNGLEAKGRHGASLVVTRVDGSLAAGELIAVRPDSLLLLSDGKDLTVDLADIETVRIVRRSKAGTFSFIGGIAGFIGMGGVVLAIAEEDVVDSKAGAAVVYGLLAGAAGAVAGAIAGTIKGIDQEFRVAGRPAAEVSRYWIKLSAHSREGRLKEPPLRIAGAPAPRPSAAAQSSSQDARLRIALGPSFPFGSQGYRTSVETGSFRFLEEVPPGESDPYAVSFSRGQVKQLRNVYFGPISLGYDLTDRLSAEIELLRSGMAPGIWTGGDMVFTSTADGLEYTTGAGSDYETSFTSLLAGVVIRSKRPTALERHILELGAVAGPAFVRLEARPWAAAGSLASASLRKVALSARVQAAYDFYIVPAFSVGAVIGYRYLRADFAGSIYSAEFDFLEAAGGPNTITRLTEVALPVRPVEWSSPFLGIRCGFRF